MTSQAAPAARRIAGLSPATLAVGGTLVGLTALYAYLNTRIYAGTLSDSAYTGSYVLGTLLHSLFAVTILSVAFSIGVRRCA